jgi:hypothetical protein
MNIQFVRHRERSVLPLQKPAVDKLFYINKCSTICGQNDKYFNVTAGHTVNNKLRWLEDVILDTV